ncbi:HNH endonuclease family protein [Thermodesulfobacteriota bacterium]
MEATKGSHRKISDAAILAKKFVSKIAKAQNTTQRLADIVEYVQDSVKVIWVEVGNDANAFTIFETLNDRGLMLAISDLLKNYLFGRSDDRLPEVQQRWMNMMGALDLLDDEGIAVTYIRHMWSSKHGLVREKELYSHITKHIRNKNHTVAFATELSDNAKLYTAILNPSNELWEKYGDTTRNHMETLNLLRMIQIRPLLLAVLGNFSVKEIQKALRLLVSWAVRFLIVGGLGGGTLEKHYSESGKAIRDNKIKTVKQLSEKLKKILPNDARFENAFSTATVSKQYLARYYLRVLEKEALGESDPELIPNDNVEVVNLEHVLPLHPDTTAWNNFDDEDHSFYVRRLGNMALLKTRINTDAGNDSFKYKKTFYKKSNYSLTKEISKSKSWDKRAIEDRQTKLSELAVTAWPLR